MKTTRKRRSSRLKPPPRLKKLSPKRVTTRANAQKPSTFARILQEIEHARQSALMSQASLKTLGGEVEGLGNVLSDMNARLRRLEEHLGVRPNPTRTRLDNLLREERSARLEVDPRFHDLPISRSGRNDPLPDDVEVTTQHERNVTQR